MRMFYMAHPVAGDVYGNIVKAKGWLRLLQDAYPRDAVFIAPWITDVELYDDSNPFMRAAGLRRCMAVIERCDGLVLAGTVVSSGMAEERDWAILHEIPVYTIPYRFDVTDPLGIGS